MATTEAKPQMSHGAQVTAIIAVVTVIVNVAFFFLSQRYFDDKSAALNPINTTPDHIMSVRIAFAIFTVITAMAAAAAAFRPRMVGHVLGALLGIVALVGAFGSMTVHFHPVLPAAMFVFGGGLLALTYFSQQRVRGAWAFLIALCGTGALVTLFGATKIRNALGFGLYHAMIVPGLFAVATVALGLIARDYDDLRS